MTPAVFLDRDGVINVDHGYVHTPDTFDFIDGVFDACAYFQRQGYLLVVVTNQSGIGRGLFSEAQFQQLTAWMLARFEQEGIHIDGVYHCPHHPDDGCDCRKPAPGLLRQAIREHDIDVARSLMLGDKAADMAAAAAAGVGRRILVRSGQALSHADAGQADEIWDSIREASSLTLCHPKP
ncbi:D-glycero-beta-D-manno-heptose 1,7-bisphosphate 7-phosphatase [Alcanivorax sp. JB21]|uniref:D-glycero-beta-D-manno-heptose 1,7-bisphosphate 7-phosphatase n=1 Tax=Alcanivorax limicola TaxID=2874102 RepID=UPI001CC04FB2|nr:D-glycero-beta-D-manno-heptose 1,7-bisphosphate 7-phosphatase [Alcanivorax limicola]MBZ2190294.1 D-glycero-beta-D-manno-heptose 1,7-bisphosphate 7-phosphatase [Alcanivorax limicola]